MERLSIKITQTFYLLNRPKLGEVGRSDYCGEFRPGFGMNAPTQFLLTIYKRVTNGEVAYPWWNFAKHYHNHKNALI